MKIRSCIGCIGMLMAVVTCLTAGVARAENIDPDDIDAQFAWGENIGWLNAEPDGQGPGTSRPSAMDIGHAVHDHRCGDLRALQRIFHGPALLT